MSLEINAEILKKFTKNIIASVLILPSICLGLTGCSKPEPAPVPVPSQSQSNFHFYIVISPIDKEQIQQARAFFIHAKGKGKKEAQIIVPGNRYTIAKFCENDNPKFPNSGTPLLDKSPIQMQAITGSAEKALAEIGDKNPNPCHAGATSLVNLAPYLNDAASKQPEKMIILIQAPWSLDEIDKVFPQIQASMDKLAKSNKVERIILFNVNQGAAPRVIKAFQSFNINGSNTVQPAASDIPQLITKLQLVRSELLKQN